MPDREIEGLPHGRSSIPSMCQGHRWTSQVPPFHLCSVPPSAGQRGRAGLLWESFSWTMQITPFPIDVIDRIYRWGRTPYDENKDTQHRRPCDPCIQFYSFTFSHAQRSSYLPTLASGISRTSDSRSPCTEDKDWLPYVPSPACTDTWRMAGLCDESAFSASRVTPPNQCSGTSWLNKREERCTPPSVILPKSYQPIE